MDIHNTRMARRAMREALAEYRRIVNRLVIERDDGKCQLCGGTASHAHHVFGRGNTPIHWREAPWHRLSLCHRCHDETPPLYMRSMHDTENPVIATLESVAFTKEALALYQEYSPLLDEQCAKWKEAHSWLEQRPIREV